MSAHDYSNSLNKKTVEENTSIVYMLFINRKHMKKGNHQLCQRTICSPKSTETLLCGTPFANIVTTASSGFW